MATTTEIQERLALYKAAETAILSGGQEYRLDNRSLTRADLGAIQKQIRDLEHQLAIATNGGSFGHSQAIFGGRRC